MFDIFKNCLFCNTSLPDSRSGDGEHIFPESIFGFWRSYDVCPQCQKVLGDEVDVLAIKTVPILNGLEALNLKDTNPHLDQMNWSGEDNLNKRKISMIKRGSKFRMKLTKTDDYLECGEENLDNFAKSWLRDKTRDSLTPEQFESEYTNFKSVYNNLSPGNTYHSEIFGYTIRRNQAKNVHIDNPIPSNITRLIAKIVTYYIHYSFSHNQLGFIEELQSIREHARYGTPLNNNNINPLRALEENKYYPFHRVAFYPDERITIIDTTFFGNLGWRTFLHSSEPLIIKDLENKPVESLFYVLDFTNIYQRKKYLGIKYPGHDEATWYDIDK